MAERQRGGADPLRAVDRRAQPRGSPAQAAPEDAEDEERSEAAEDRGDRDRDEGADHADGPPAVEAAPVDRVRASLHERRADEPAHERLARARRQATPPGEEVPRRRTDQPRADHGDRLVRRTWTMPAIVAATADPIRIGPSIVNTDARTIAWIGVAARVATSVAMAFDALNPFVAQTRRPADRDRARVHPPTVNARRPKALEPQEG